MNCENGKCKSVMVNEKKYYASMISLQVNDWMVGCIVDSDVALPEYADNIRIIQRLTIGTFSGFCVGIAYIFLLSRRILAHGQREIRTIQSYNENYSPSSGMWTPSTGRITTRTPSASG